MWIFDGSKIDYSSALEKCGYLDLVVCNSGYSTRFVFVSYFFFQEARLFKLGIHIENEWFYCGLRIRSIALFLFSICPFFLYFKG